MSSSANSSSKRNRAGKQDERVLSQQDAIDATSPREDCPPSQTGLTLETAPGNTVSNDFSHGFRPSTSHVPMTSLQGFSNDHRPGGGTDTRVDAQSCSGQAPRRRPDVLQSRARPLIPAAPTPNASVFENQQQRYNRRMSVNHVSTGPRASNRICHSSFPYPMGGRPSNHRPGHLLPRSSRQSHVDQRHSHQCPAGSRVSRLRQLNGLAGIDRPVVNQSFNAPFPHSIPEGTMHSNTDLRFHVLSQNPGDSAYVHGVEGLSSPSVYSSQSYLPADVNRNPNMSLTGPAMVIMPGSYPHQAQLASTQFAINPGPGMGFGQLQPQPGPSTAPTGYQSEVHSCFMPSQSIPGHNTAWQMQSHPHLPTSTENPLQAFTNQTGFLSQQPYVSSQPQYFTPPFQSTAPNPGFSEQGNPPVFFSLHDPVPETNAQMLEHPVQLLSEESNVSNDYIVDMMSSFDHVV